MTKEQRDSIEDACQHALTAIETRVMMDIFHLSCDANYATPDEAIAAGEWCEMDIDARAELIRALEILRSQP